MTNDLSNLARWVRTRRDQRDWTQHDVWSKGGPSNSTLTAIEAGRAPAPSRATLRKLDAGLEWVPGSAKEALAGYEPTALENVDEPSATPKESVGGNPEGGDSLLYRKPTGIDDAKWERLKAETRDYLEWLIDRAASER